MPVGRYSHAGLAIVNFVDAQACHQCFLALRQMQEQRLMVGIKSIGQSYIQGFAENLAYYVVVSRQDERVTDKPLIFVDGEAAGQKMLDYLIKHCVTNEMKQRAAEQAEALYSTRKTGQVCGPVQPGCLSRNEDVPGPKLSGQGRQGPSEASRADAELRLLCQRLGCKTCDGMMVFSL